MRCFRAASVSMRSVMSRMVAAKNIWPSDFHDDKDISMGNSNPSFLRPVRLTYRPSYDHKDGKEDMIWPLGADVLSL